MRIDRRMLWSSRTEKNVQKSPKPRERQGKTANPFMERLALMAFLLWKMKRLINNRNNHRSSALFKFRLVESPNDLSVSLAFKAYTLP